jgi:hypothetical protein
VLFRDCSSSLHLTSLVLCRPLRRICRTTILEDYLKIPTGLTFSELTSFMDGKYSFTCVEHMTCMGHGMLQLGLGEETSFLHDLLPVLMLLL